MSNSAKSILVSSTKNQKNNYQPNLITESRQTYSALEKNIVVTIINKLTILYFEKSLPLFPHQEIDFLIPYSEISSSRNYEEVEQAAKSLQVKQEGFAYTNEKGERFFKYMVPFPFIENVKTNGKMFLKITMTSKAIPYYTEMGKQWTSYDFKAMRSLSSVYSKRLYEILMSHHRSDRFQYDVDHLRHIINVPTAFDYYEFTRRCLDTACSEIEKKTGIMLRYEPARKVGKKVVAIQFFKSSQLAEAQGEAIANQHYINNIPVGEAISLAYRLFELYTFNELQRKAIVDDSERLTTFFRVHSEIVSGLRNDIVNHTAYMVKSLKIEKIRGRPKKKVAEKPVGSTSIPKSIGSILGGMSIGKK
ncbi:replication initiation protein [Larkinella sp. GY13]|uniref:replication initiation protein n=1 Tax=Larkinella sp. GY13 TaxID=3453720 RepID=UPI003EE87232